jgi:hypothetical protein
VASWQAIEYAGQTLVSILERHLSMVLPGGNVDVQLASASEFSLYAKTTTPTITLFLYRILETPELRNSVMRTRANGTVARQPLALELCYMVTPWGVRAQQSEASDAQAAAEEHRLLGLVLQAFYDRAELARSELFQANPTDTVWGQTDTVQIILESPPVDEIFRIWDSTEESYRVSLTYRVRVLGLDPLETQAPSRVVDARFNVGER